MDLPEFTLPTAYFVFTVIIILLLAFAYMFYQQQHEVARLSDENTTRPTQTHIRVMAWNCEWVSGSEKGHLMKDTKDSVMDAIKRVCDVISKNNPDIALLNEISDVPTLRIMSDYLTNKYKLVYNIYMFENRKRPEHIQFSGLFIKKYLDPNNNIRIMPIYSWYRNFHFVVNIGESKVRFFSVHLKADGNRDLSHVREQQLLDVARLALNAQKRGENIVILGDFNEIYGSVLYNTLTLNGFVNVKYSSRSTTNPYRSFTQWSDKDSDNLMDSDEIRDLDHIFVDRELYRRLATVYIDRFTAQKIHPADTTSRISDHWPIIAEFSLIEDPSIQSTSGYQAEFGTKKTSHRAEKNLLFRKKKNLLFRKN